MRYGNAEIPEELSYTKNHLWVNTLGDVSTLGWTDYIQSNAGDVNYLELPKKGTRVKAGDEFGSIETSKWVDKLYSPIEGEVVEVNDSVVKQPELINQFPFTEGWFVKIKPEDEMASRDLLSPADYLAFLKLCEEED